MVTEKLPSPFLSVIKRPTGSQLLKLPDTPTVLPGSAATVKVTRLRVETVAFFALVFLHFEGIGFSILMLLKDLPSRIRQNYCIKSESGVSKDRPLSLKSRLIISRRDAEAQSQKIDGYLLNPDLLR